MNRTIYVTLACLAAACTGTTSNNPRGGGALGFAVINSDYKSTSVSLVDPTQGMLAQDDCIDSGSVAPLLSMALSGDVVLASQTQPNDELVLVDRTNSALTYLSPTTCQVTRQVSVSTGFFSNPHDVVAVTPDKTYVTRSERNAAPTGANDQGDDILIVNPTTGAVSGRIDLSMYASASGLQARPDRALLVDGKVYVTLSSQSGDFKTTGGGRVVVIDTATDTVTATIDLRSQKECTAPDYVAASKMLVVGCTGDYTDANQLGQSGIVFIDISGDTPKVATTITAAQLGGRAPFGFGVVGDNTLLIVVPGDFSGTPADTLWSYQIDTATPTKIFTADAAFTLGGITADTGNHLAFVTDASATTPVVHVFDVSDGAAIKLTSQFNANPKSGLPPRQIAWY